MAHATLTFVAGTNSQRVTPITTHIPSPLVCTTHISIYKTAFTHLTPFKQWASRSLRSAAGARLCRGSTRTKNERHFTDDFSRHICLIQCDISRQISRDLLVQRDQSARSGEQARWWIQKPTRHLTLADLKDISNFFLVLRNRSSPGNNLIFWECTYLPQKNTENYVFCPSEHQTKCIQENIVYLPNYFVTL